MSIVIFTSIKHNVYNSPKITISLKLNFSKWQPNTNLFFFFLLQSRWPIA